VFWSSSVDGDGNFTDLQLGEIKGDSQTVEPAFSTRAKYGLTSGVTLSEVVSTIQGITGGPTVTEPTPNISLEELLRNQTPEANKVPSMWQGLVRPDKGSQ
jgi:hypothetical protein